MYTQIFGNYLLNTGMVTKEQLISALEAQSTTRVSLGALAIHKGYMSATEAERVFILQTRQDKRFGEIAVEEGYLTQEQVEELLDSQIPGFILLGQILVDRGILTAPQLENIVTDYRSEYEIFDLDEHEEKNDVIKQILSNIDHSYDELQQEYVIDYLLLLFNNLVRFIGSDFTPLDIIQLPEVPTNCCVSQDFSGPEFKVDSALDMSVEASIAFASRYADETFSEFNEYVRASMEDFLNLHNGLFIVNMSNDHAIELTLQPPLTRDDSILTTEKHTYILPILFPFGTIHFICSIHSEK